MENKNPGKKETIMLIFAVLIVIGGIIAIIIKPQWKINTKNSKSALKQSETTNESSSSIPKISVMELKEKIDNNEKIYLLDVQTQEQYLEKHVPSSLNIPFSELEARKSEIPKDKEIIVLCTNNSTCQTSTKAAELLLSLGFKNIKDFKDGVAGWEEQNLPVISGFEAVFKSISTDQLKQKIDNKEDIAILDIRDKEEFDKSHIKNAFYLSFEEVASKIKELPRNKELIVYDKTGSRSKLITEMLTQKGFTQAMNLIDGFSIWQSKNYPIE